MIEPTETESKQDLDLFIQALRDIADEAERNPEFLGQAPSKCKVKRLDEVSAARRPCLAG
jgi:glycine dehydrogenase subunit 2